MPHIRSRKLSRLFGALLMPLSLSPMLHAGTNPGDILTLSMTDKVTEFVKTTPGVDDGNPQTPNLPSYDQASTNTTSVSLTAVLGNLNSETGVVTPLNLTEITPETEFEVKVGDMTWSGFLSQDLTYTDENKATKRSAFIQVNTDSDSKPTGANGIKLAWTSTKLTVSISRSNKDEDNKGSPIAESLIGADEPNGPATVVKTSIPVSISFGPVSTAATLPPPVAFVSGTASITQRKIGSGDGEVSFDLNSISVTGALDTAPPAITVKAPAGNLTADDGSATLTGKVTDGHGIFSLAYKDLLSGGLLAIENTTVVKGPPARAPEKWWGATEWNWTLPLTSLPHGTTALEIWATDVGGNLKQVPVTLYRKLPARFVGRWDVLLNAENTPGGLPGYLSLMVSQTGGVTGSLRLRGMSAAKPVIGFWNDGGLKAYVDKGKPEAFTLNAEVADAEEVDPAELAMRVNLFQGTATGLRKAVPALARGSACRVTFDAKNKIAADSLLIGRFNAYLARDTVSQPAPSYGHGHFTIVSTNTGVTTITGKLADGTGLTGAGIVGPKGQMPFFLSLYGNKGSFHASPQVDGATGMVTTSPALWFRPAALADKQFPAGIDIGLPVVAARYTAPLKDQRILGLLIANAAAAWGGDGTTGNVPQNVTVTPAPQNKISPVGGTTGFTATVDAAKGTIIGVFKLPTTPSVAANYSAVIVGNQAFGFYLAAGAKGETLKRYGFFTLQAPAVLD